MQNCTDLDCNAYMFSYSAYQKPQDFPNPSTELHSCLLSQCVLNVLLSLFHFKSHREEARNVTRGCRYLLGAAHGEAPGSSGQARDRLTRPLLWKRWIARSFNSGMISGCRMSTNGITKNQGKEQQWQRTQGDRTGLIASLALGPAPRDPCSKGPAAGSDRAQPLLLPHRLLPAQCW